MPVFTHRRAARVLLVDGDNRLLMFRGWDPARPEHRYWFTPGGGLDGDEPAAVAAARELAEETGLQISSAECGAPVWRDVTEFPFDGRWYRQEQEFFLVRVPYWEVDTAGFNEVEQGCIDAFRWWRMDELERSEERFYPVQLLELFRRVLVGGAC
ncbi:MAG TPA: NUDIX domain-containing protein [Micromonospora sp.]|nr:NUDIX domain-containing protein [Micromonospora sp.]